MPNASSRARLDSTGVQAIHVTVDGGYRPAIIRARAGVPLRLAFQRLDASECAERVVFSTPRLERHLALAATTVVDLPAQPVGEVRFTCGMGRYVGRIELVQEPVSRVVRLRRSLSRLEAPLGSALVLWICSLPLIAIVAVLAFDATVAVIAAGAALIAWLTGCLWVFAHSEASAGYVATAESDRGTWRFRRP